MPEFVERSWPYQLGTLLAVFLAMLAPLLDANGRRGIAITFALGAVASLVAAVVQMPETRTLEIANPFLRAGAESADEAWFFHIATVEAPGWRWGASLALGLLIPAVAFWMRRDRGPRVPRPLVAAALVGAWVLGTRVLLERAAAPHPLVWAVGISWAQLVMFFLIGWYTGKRSSNLKVLLLVVFGSAMLLRLMVAVLAFFATTQDWGIWANVSTVTDFQPPGLDPVDLEGASPTERWLRASFVAQMAQGLFSFVFGTVLAFVPWAVARRSDGGGSGA